MLEYSLLYDAVCVYRVVLDEAYEEKIIKLH